MYHVQVTAKRQMYWRQYEVFHQGKFLCRTWTLRGAERVIHREHERHARIAEINAKYEGVQR